MAAEPSFERLLRAARDLFATEGYASTSLESVCAAAGVTKGSLYHHFGGKAELFEAVFAREAATQSEYVAEQAARGSDPWQMAYAGVRAFLDASQDPAVQRIMLVDGLSVLGWERMREIEAEHGLALIKAVIAGLAGAREIREADVDVLAHLLFGALVEGALLMSRSDDEAAARDAVEREVRALIDGLRPTAPPDPA